MIPNSVSAYVESEMADSLSEDINAIAIGVNEDHPHLFLIGLTYLNGIDLEMDTKKALDLIWLAAQKGEPEILRKQVNMYRMQACPCGFDKNFISASNEPSSRSHKESTDKLIPPPTEVELEARLAIDKKPGKGLL